MRWISVLMLIVAACGSPTAVDDGPTPPGGSQAVDVKLVAISTGSEHVCGLAEDGRAWCWGSDEYRELGADSAPLQCSDLPFMRTHGCSRFGVATSTSLRFTALSAGGGFSCGVVANGDAHCWGGDIENRLGAAPRPTTLCGAVVAAVPCTAAPLRVTGGLKFRFIEAGETQTCAITIANEAYCWGANSAGLLGFDAGAPASNATPTPVAAGQSWRDIAPGYRSACGTTSAGTLSCWGLNLGGSLGVNDIAVERSSNPLAVAASVPLHGAVVGNYFACGLDDAGTAWCWGSNATGALGLGLELGQGSCPTPPTCSLAPIRTAGSVRFASLSASTYHVCGIDTDARAWCWGRNFDGQIGNGVESAHVLAPTEVGGGLRFRSVSVGRQFSCGLTLAGDAWCWGANYEGQLGDGTFLSRATPVRVQFRN